MVGTINMNLYRIHYQGRKNGIIGHTVVFGRSKADARKSFLTDNPHVRVTQIVCSKES